MNSVQLLLNTYRHYTGMRTLSQLFAFVMVNLDRVLRQTCVMSCPRVSCNASNDIN